MKKIIFMLICFSIISCKDMTQDDRLWKNGIIPFKFANFDADKATKLYESMAIWEEGVKRANKGKSLIKFIDMTGKDTSDYPKILYVSFIDLKDMVGAITDTKYYKSHASMKLYINTNKDSDDNIKFIYCHELGHILGLDIHEFQRKDRDVYLKIDYNFILSKSLFYISQFFIRDPLFYDIESYDFDYFSCMMCMEDVMIEVLMNPLPQIVYSLVTPSPTDFKKVRDIYFNNYYL